MGRFIQRESEHTTRFAGQAKDNFDDLRTWWKGFNVSYVWTTKGVPVWEGSDQGNGSYDGWLGAMQRDEADVTLTPMPVYYFNDTVADYGPYVLSSKGAILSIPRYHFENVDVLTIFFNFKIYATLLLVLTAVVFVLMLSLVDFLPSVRTSIVSAFNTFARSLWYFYTLLVLQPQYEGQRLVAKQLVMFVSVGALFFSFIWSNLMTTDIVSIERSKIINSLEDLARVDDVHVLFLPSDPVAVPFNETITPNKKPTNFQLINKKGKVMGYDTPSVYTNTFGYPNELNVFISLEATCKYSVEVLCSLFGVVGHIAKERFNDYQAMPFFSKHIRADVKAKLWRTYMTVLDTGLLKGWVDNMLADSRDAAIPRQAGRACDLTDKLEEYIQDEMSQRQLNKIQLQMANIVSVFYLLAACCCLAMLSVFAELVVSGVTSLSNQSKVVPFFVKSARHVVNVDCEESIETVEPYMTEEDFNTNITDINAEVKVGNMA